MINKTRLNHVLILSEEINNGTLCSALFSPTLMEAKVLIAYMSPTPINMNKKYIAFPTLAAPISEVPTLPNITVSQNPMSTNPN